MLLFAEGGITIGWPEIIAVLTVMGGAVAALFKLLISSKDREFALILAERAKDALECDSMKKSYQEIAAEAIESAKETTAYYRKLEGKPPLLMVAPVVSESHSPSTARQREAAGIATMRAQLAAIKLAAGQEPRKEPEHAKE